MITPPPNFNGINSSHCLTPVKCFDSTKIASKDSNTAACKARLDVIVKTTEDNFNKWQLLEKRGISLCTSVEAIKTKALEKLNCEGSCYDFTRSYPDELKSYCEKLAKIILIFEDIAESSKECLRQLKALRKLPGSCDGIFYRSWQLNEFITFLTELSERYEKEVKNKVFVAKNLAHCTKRSELICYSSKWEYPQHVDSYIKLLFLFFKEEINVKK